MDKELKKEINEAIKSYFWGNISNISKAERELGLEPNRLHKDKYCNHDFYAAACYYYFKTLGIDRTALDKQIEQIIEEYHARSKQND